jgi:hypothetical protein
MTSDAKTRVSRRAFLRSAGTAVALPYLASLFPRAAGAGPGLAQRLLVYYIPNGMVMQAWTPATRGAGYQLTPILSSLAPVKDDVLVLTGLANRSGKPDGPGDHAGGTGAFLTSFKVRKTDGPDILGSISMDQLLVQQAPQPTRFPSLQLGLEGGGSSGGCDSGYSCAYTRSISWAGPKTPLQKVVGPQAVFDLLFAGSDPGKTKEEQERRQRLRKSVLDHVRADAQHIQARLGKTDRQKLDEYMTGVRELETRLTALGQICQPGDKPAANATIPEQSRLLNELMVLAFQCDLTRVMTFMFANGQTGRPYPFIGVSRGHHEISHHQNRPENLRDLQIINTFEVAQFADLLQRLKAVKEGERTLLDSAAVYFSSEIADSNAHHHYNLPVLLAGRCGGAWKTGQHLVYDKEQPMANLFISILGAMGVRVSKFGADGTGPLPGLA